MTERELQRKRREIESGVVGLRVRIRRYTLDPRLREKDREGLRKQADEAWKKWLALWDAFNALPEKPSQNDTKQLLGVEKELLQVSREADLIQRELISEESFNAGIRTVTWLSVALVGLVFLYLATHGVRGLNFAAFEPLPEWGPLKYVEVAFWSTFGVLCWLLFLSTRYLARRDFDRWYQPWYVSTVLRAPFLSMILMMVVLEFVEWYGEGKWIENYLLEEGNKFYFIVFMSFSLGLMSEETSAIMRELAEGVVKFVRNVVGRVSDRLSSAVARADITRK
ncbi:MAG: hypothetical protein IH847_06050 [Acidobacteria bacterium]|nr:hypothetical protein [Acidobacteriota bacterium]